MDGMLSQDEINALLSGMDLSGDMSVQTPSDSAPENTVPDLDSVDFSGAGVVEDADGSLTEVERDAIGEVANISMGSSATTLYSLVNRKVNITTPVVELSTWDQLLSEYEKPCVFIQIKYTMGLDGTNILVLKENDVKIITDLMMGGDGINTEGEIGELHLSAISEAMNQMMGSAATSLSTMLNSVIDISPPSSSLLDLTKVQAAEEIAPFLAGTFVKISFRMQIGNLVDSTIMQLYPIDFAKKLVDTFIGNQIETQDTKQESPVKTVDVPNEPFQSQNPTTGMKVEENMGQQPDMGMGYDMGQQPNMNMHPNMGMGYGMGQQPNMGMGYGMGQQPNMNMQSGINVQPAQFQNFAENMTNAVGQENIGLIMDVPLEVTVELGRTTKSIAEILDFAPGTIIELDRIAGEPIDVLVNGKYVAKGEVVVIEESFGIRVTEIIK